MADLPLFIFTTQERIYGEIIFRNLDSGGSNLDISARQFIMPITSSKTTQSGLVQQPVKTLTLNGGGLALKAGSNNILTFTVPKAEAQGWTRGDYTIDILDVTDGSDPVLFMPVRLQYVDPGAVIGYQARSLAANYSASRQPIIVTAVPTSGPQGPRGNAVLSGTTAPTSATGVNNDYYIQTNGNVRTFYGPKAGGAWPAGINLNYIGQVDDVPGLTAALNGKQAQNDNLTSLAGLTLVADRLLYSTAAKTLALAVLTSFARDLLNDSDSSTARQTLGLVIGTDVQAYDSDLAAIAALATQSFGRNLLTLADAVSARSNLGLVIGTNVQAYDSDLAAIAALTTQSYGRSLLTALDSATARGLLQLGSASIYNAGSAANNIPVLDSNGQLLSSVMPALAITDVFTVASQSAMLALVAQRGDVAIRTDLGTAYILSTDSPSTLADWKALPLPSGVVMQVAGLSGPSITAAQLKTAIAIAVADITDASANGRSLISSASYAAMRGLLGLVIGTDVQAYDSDLAAIAALATQSFGRNLLTLADAVSARSNLGLVIGTDVQAYDSDLAAIAALATQSFGRNLLTLSDVAATRVALGLNSTAAVSFRNRIRNGDFSVNQRAVSGTVSLGAGVYGHDGWKGGASGGTYTFSAGVLNISANTLQQVIEGAIYLPEGGTYTLSWAGSAQARINGGSYAASPITVNGLTAGANATIEFGTGTVAFAQFEPGTNPTLFERRDDELRRCERYYERLGGSAYTKFSLMFAATADIGFALFTFRTKKRVPPSLSYGGGFSIYNGSNYTFSSLVADQVDTNSLSPRVNSSGMPSGTSLLLSANNDPNAYIAFSAEL